MAFAAETKVPIAQTQAEIEALLARWKARATGVMKEPDKALVMFRLEDRNIRFTLPLLPERSGEPQRDRNKREQENRARWRRLLLVIKGKFESIESGIETLEEAFLAHVQMPDGRTVMESIRGPLALNYSGGSVPLLLPPAGKQSP